MATTEYYYKYDDKHYYDRQSDAETNCQSDNEHGVAVVVSVVVRSAHSCCITKPVAIINLYSAYNYNNT